MGTENEIEQALHAAGADTDRQGHFTINGPKALHASDELIVVRSGTNYFVHGSPHCLVSLLVGFTQRSLILNSPIP